MSGRTDFNAELFGAEHLMIEDETPSTDIRSRRTLGTNIKAFAVNKSQSCDAKGRQAITLSPFWRLSISLNDEPEDLMILPPISDSEEDSIGDKIILLRARKAEMPMKTEELSEFDAFWETLISELPAFCHFLDCWQVPEELRHSRFGFKVWQHPELLLALDALAPETRLLSFIDETIFSEVETGPGGKVKRKQSWVGTAEALEKMLHFSSFECEARRLLTWAGATGTYLGRLAHSRPERVRRARTGDAPNWELFGAAMVEGDQAV